MEPESGTYYIYIVEERELPDIPQPEECAHHSQVRLHRAFFTGHLIYKSSRSSSWRYTRENVVIDPAGSGHDTRPPVENIVYIPWRTRHSQVLQPLAAINTVRRKGMKNKIKNWGLKRHLCLQGTELY
jgi:hypothetical protein